MLGMDQIRIDQIAGLCRYDDPLYVLVAGGIGVGKSWLADRHLGTLALVDVDRFMEILGYTDYDPKGFQFRHAMDVTAKHVDELKAARSSLVAMGTCSDFPFARQRLEWAKADSYRTVLLHVTAPLDQAIRQNTQRRMAGKRAVAQHDEHPVISSSIERSGRTVETLLFGYTSLIDYHCPHSNER